MGDAVKVEKKPTQGKQTLCNVCGKCVPHIEVHMKTHHMSYIQCQNCGKMLRPSSYKQHISKGYCYKSPTEEMSYICDQCGKRYLSAASLKIHSKIHSDDKENYFECNWCMKRFPSKTLLASHVVTHTQEKNWSCEICNKKFSIKSSLRRHQLQQHMNEIPNDAWLCTICDQKFESKSDILKHLEETHQTQLNEENISFICQTSSQKKQIRHEKETDTYIENKINENITSMLHVLLKNRNPPFCCLCLNVLSEEDPIQLEDNIYLDAEDHSKSNLTVIQIIESVLHRNDFVSTSVCTSCVTSTVSAYKFITMCEQATQKMNKIVDGITSALDNHDNKKIENCPTVFLVTDMNSYMSTLHYDNKKTVSCNNSYSDLKCALSRFKRISHAENPVLCDACGKRFSLKRTLIKHIKCHCNGGAKNNGKIPCEICSRYVSRSNYHKHKKACERDYPLNGNPINVKPINVNPIKYNPVQTNSRPRTLCNICGKDFRNLTLHLKTHYHTYRECEKCGRKLISESYEHHISRAHCYKPRKPNPAEKRPYKCDQCDKRYSSAVVLRFHMKIHSDNKNDYSECVWCQKRFPSERQLIEHIVTHTQEKNFTCKICGEQFAARSTLRRHHRRRHLDPEKQYEPPVRKWTCAVCGKKFVRERCMLRHHERAHHNLDTSLHVGKKQVRIVGKNYNKRNVDEEYTEDSSSNYDS